MNATIDQTYENVIAHVRETALLESTNEMLQWDERTYLPAGGRDFRAEQVSYLAGLIHRRQTDPQLGGWLEELSDSDLASDRHSLTGCTIHRLRRDYQRANKLPQSLVESLSRATVVGQQQWEDARREDDFAAFLPALQNVIALKIDAAQAMRHADQSAYDALLDEYEEGAQSDDLAQSFKQLRSLLVPLVAAIGESKSRPAVEVLRRSFPVDAQRELCKHVAARVGYDFHRGRLDETSHPFCCSLGPGDCRILTRYDEHWFPGALYGTLHEAGHGMYDQGMPADQYGLPAGSYVSLGIHESQSRLWENMVGRSRAFSKHFFPQMQAAFPSALDGFDAESFYGAVNTVEPSFIRVEADEVTYNLHIIIRFELERLLIAGELKAADLPDAWNSKYQEYLAITPTKASEGVMQDVHWGAGLIGYFPTYTLGNLCAAQIYVAADRDLGDLNVMFEHGEFQALQAWLVENIHRHGRTFTPNELIQRATGEKLSSKALIEYLNRKYADIYNL